MLASLAVALSIVQSPVSVTYQQKLTHVPAGSSERFGAAVALDGDRLAVGTAEIFGDGTVFLYERSGGSWVLAQTIDAPPGGYQSYFGSVLALEDDTLVIGSPYQSQGGSPSGAVYVYVHDGSSWTFQQQLTSPTVGYLDFFGQTLSISGDTIAVGCPFDDTAVFESGSVYVFVRGGTTWTEQARLAPLLPMVADRFGGGLALEGDTLAIGAFNDDAGQSNSGAVYVFTRSSNVWTQVQKLKPADPNANQYFGETIDLQGSRLAISARGDDHAGYNTGAAYVFELAGANWVQQAKLLSSAPVATDNFGSSLAFEGELLAVGAWLDSELAGSSGAGYLFELQAGAWHQIAKIKAPDAQVDDTLGHACDFQGETLVLGAFRDDGTFVDAGSAYVYRVAPEPVAYCTAQTSSAGCVPAIGFTGVPSMSLPSVFDVSAVEIHNQKPGLLFYGVDGRSQLPFSGGILCVKGPVRRTPPQPSGGSAFGADCTGSFHFDFNARAQSGGDPSLAAGTVVNAQYWYRDPQASSTTGLSDGLEFELSP